MTVADLMTSDVEFVSPGTPVSEAAAIMGDLGVGALPIGTADDLQGILTDRDILFRVVARSRDASTPVGEVMTTTIFSCRPEDSVAAALNLMGARNIRRLPVLDNNGRIVGIVTLSDLSRTLLLRDTSIQQAVRDLAEG